MSYPYFQFRAYDFKCFQDRQKDTEKKSEAEIQSTLLQFAETEINHELRVCSESNGFIETASLMECASTEQRKLTAL